MNQKQVRKHVAQLLFTPGMPVSRRLAVAKTWFTNQVNNYDPGSLLRTGWGGEAYPLMLWAKNFRPNRNPETERARKRMYA